MAHRGVDLMELLLLVAGDLVMGVPVAVTGAGFVLSAWDESMLALGHRAVEMQDGLRSLITSVGYCAVCCVLSVLCAVLCVVLWCIVPCLV